jgi:hypothetical protein
LRTAEGERDEALGQDRTEHFLACLAGDVEANLGGQFARNAVREFAKHAQIETVCFDCRGLAATKRELVAGALQRGDALAVDFECNERDRGRHLERLRALRPDHARAQFVVACAHPQARAATIDHRDRLAIERDLLWPVRIAAGQRHPTVDFDMPALLQRSALRVGRNFEDAWPQAGEIARVGRRCASEQRTFAVLAILHDPASPGLETGWYGARRGLRARAAQQAKQHDQCTHERLLAIRIGSAVQRPWRALGVCAMPPAAATPLQCVSRRQPCSRQARMKPVRKNR